MRIQRTRFATALTAAAFVGCAPSPSATNAASPAAAPPSTAGARGGVNAQATTSPSTTTTGAPAATGSLLPPRVKGQNPFGGVRFYVNEYNGAAQQAHLWENTRAADARLLQKIAIQPTADWWGEWSGDIETVAHNLLSATNKAGMLPVAVVYNVPNRDCGQYSAGGAKSPEGYRKWIHELVAGIGGYRVIVVLEPDALGLLTKCLSPADQQARLAMIHEAVDALEATPGASVYIDAGHAKWVPADEMATRLKAAGIANADGFALNVSNYIATDESIAYGHKLSAATGGKHFIIDTGRNGNGPTADAQWCNPSGRALGNPPTVNTGDPLVDAFFWVKPPGESDGTCNGGPKAGEFWPEIALGMAKAAKW